MEIAPFLTQSRPVSLLCIFKPCNMEISDLKEKTSDLSEHVEDLAQTFYNLSVVRITRKVSDISAGGVVMLLTVLLGLFVLLFMGFAFAWWMGELVNNRAGGFLISAGLFILLLFGILAIKKKIIFPYIRNLIIRNVYDNKD